MSEQRMLEIVRSECSASSQNEAQLTVVAARYGYGFKDTYYQLVRRGHVETAPSSPGAIVLTKEGRAAAS